MDNSYMDPHWHHVMELLRLEVPQSPPAATPELHDDVEPVLGVALLTWLLGGAAGRWIADRVGTKISPGMPATGRVAAQEKERTRTKLLGGLLGGLGGLGSCYLVQAAVDRLVRSSPPSSTSDAQGGWGLLLGVGSAVGLLGGALAADLRLQQLQARARRDQ